MLKPERACLLEETRGHLIYRKGIPNAKKKLQKNGPERRVRCCAGHTGRNAGVSWPRPELVSGERTSNLSEPCEEGRRGGKIRRLQKKKKENQKRNGCKETPRLKSMGKTTQSLGGEGIRWHPETERTA